MSSSLEYLFKRYTDKTGSPAEREELMRLLQNTTHDDELKQLLDAWILQKEANHSLSPERSQSILDAIAAADTTEELTTPAKIRPIKTWMRYAIAAILILAIGSGIYYLNHQSWKSYKSVESQFKTKTAAPEISPGTNRAILTLSNGTQKELSLADNGLQLQSDAVLLTTPRGGQYQAVLPDGSKVWLNAASSVKFPSKFDKERRVEVTGEVYFEITKDANKPFKVFGGDQEIEVLGTSFNVHVYDDEPSKTSLAEGSIKINQLMVKPGQAYQNGKLITTDIGQDIAWKNGIFNFKNITIPIALQQLSRWYNIDIVYNGAPPTGTLGGSMDRSLSLQQVLNGLNGIAANFDLKGRVLYVTAL